jgi:ATP-binding cassette subfamily B protein
MIFGKHINRYYLRHFPLLLLGVLALVAVDYLQLIIPNLYGMVIAGMDEGVVEQGGILYTFDMAFLLDKICMPMVVVIFIIVLGRMVWRVCFLGSSIMMEEDLRNRMFSHNRELSREYYQVNKVGGLMSLYTNDLDNLQECYAWGILECFDATFLGGLAIYKMFRMDPVLTGLSLIPMVFLLSSSILVGKYMSAKWEKRQEAFSSLSDFAQESYSGIAVIKAFVKEGKELWAFSKINKDNENANIEFTRASVLFRVMVMLFVESVVCVILGYGGYLVWKGDFAAAQLVEFHGYFNAIIWPIMAVSDLIDMSSRGRASLKRISELLDAKVDVVDREGVAELMDAKGNIEFRDLTFRYPDGELDALKNVTFTIRAGENVGLVGKTGSGKTTLVDLILRTYNVPDGTVFIDGQDVNTVSIRSVRAACAYVPQDNFLFSDTISNNIGFARDSFDEHTVRYAAKMADVAGNIEEFALGYETVLGERGVTVSGGQKQRISIARALLKDAPILILDDSVSAVDTKTEKAILENLRNVRAGKTTILIAHRISTIEKMDKILFIDDGSVVAVGDHRHLYETCSEYRKMVDLQKLEEEGGAGNE